MQGHAYWGAVPSLGEEFMQVKVHTQSWLFGTLHSTYEAAE